MEAPEVPLLGTPSHSFSAQGLRLTLISTAPQLEADMLLMRDTLAEHRSLCKRQREAFIQLDRRHARTIDAYRMLKETGREKYEGALRRLAEAKEEILAWELRGFLAGQDLSASDEALKKARHERLILEGFLEAEERNCSSLDEQLQAERTARTGLEQLLDDAYVEVARAMGLRLDTGSMSSADKLERMLRQFRMMRMDNDALQGTLEPVLFDGCAKDAMISELETDNDALAEAASEKDKVISALNEEKDQLLSEASDLHMEVDQVVQENGRLTRAGLDKDTIIATLSEQKAQWILTSHVQDAENAALGEANARLHCENLAKDRKISELEDDNQRLQETTDASSCSLAPHRSENQADGEIIAALKGNIRGLQASALEKDREIAMLGDRNSGLRNLVDALHDSFLGVQGDIMTKDMQIKALKETVEALRGSLEFVYLEQRARQGTLFIEPI